MSENLEREKFAIPKTEHIAAGLREREREREDDCNQLRGLLFENTKYLLGKIYCVRKKVREH